MAGNAWEWVNDRYQYDYYNMHPVDGWPADPQGPTGPLSYRVMRGSSWSNYYESSLRTARRFGYPPAGRNGGIGFRCARD
jgi:formylglycine-generating enzyme required for sulfatase activity